MDSISQNILFNTLNFNTVSTFSKFHCQIHGQFFFNSNLISQKKHSKQIDFEKLKNSIKIIFFCVTLIVDPYPTDRVHNVGQYQKNIEKALVYPLAERGRFQKCFLRHKPFIEYLFRQLGRSSDQFQAKFYFW